MKKLLLASLFIIPTLSAISKTDVEKCFAQANIGSGQYKKYIGDFTDVNAVKQWATDNITPEWKVEAFKDCLDKQQNAMLYAEVIGIEEVAPRQEERRALPAPEERLMLEYNR